MNYKTIAAPCTRTLVEKRSEFIAAVTPIQTVEQATACIQDAHAAYRKARHHVYAYVLRDQNISRYSDDGEPQGTAGLPVLEVIRKQGLTDVCCVVSRIFGGVLLGANGLVRAYSQSCAQALREARTMEMCACCTMTILCDYNFYGKLQFALASDPVIFTDTQFTESVTVTLLVLAEQAQPLRDRLFDLSNGTISIALEDAGFHDFSSVLPANS
ncbi:YigZ family protein [Ruminococcus sp.]|uniref:IMPACT family protein n=1 Tax=Ruminococcus sp. TaxID=41978 RepID=UPI0025F78B00|nr:YigZ family protein [Ruminococcus sp.]MCI5816814.1 YigZ family protein [Ruminococcus sp.]MDD7555401.1 YigZ family protein [Ruminococcus sp.]MDY4963486.1 YigZ family protein [Ruminococcus callidus]